VIRVNFTIVQHFINLSELVEKRHDLFHKIDNEFKEKLPKQLSKFAIELLQESAVLKEEGQDENSKHKKLQSNFVFQEAVAEHKNIYRGRVDRLLLINEL
jgi:pyruvate/2-oxoglutarate dehydrogenase complex dihydrolipoamide dehydrogenase (E3) component